MRSNEGVRDGRVRKTANTQSFDRQTERKRNFEDRSIGDRRELKFDCKATGCEDTER